MPVTLVTDINEDVSYALWQIEEPLEALVAQYEPSIADRKILDETKVESRKREWLSARLALKTLLKQRNLAGNEIYKDEFGKPHLQGSTAHISISHTEGYGAAVLNMSGPVGIDIEYPRAQIQRIARKFLHTDERAWTSEDMNKLTQVWSAKEALYKLHGRTQLTFAEQLLVHAPVGRFPVQGEIKEGATESFHLHYQDHHGLITCLAFG